MATIRALAKPCVQSKRADGEHAWLFDSDDPYTFCDWCGEVRDALTGAVVLEAAR